MKKKRSYKMSGERGLALGFSQKKHASAKTCGCGEDGRRAGQLVQAEAKDSQPPPSPVHFFSSFTYILYIPNSFEVLQGRSD